MTSKPPGWHEAGFSASETKTKGVWMKESTFQKIDVVSREFEPFLAPCPLDFFNQSVLIEPVLPRAAPLWGTWKRTLHSWRKVGKDKKTTSGLRGVCHNHCPRPQIGLIFILMLPSSSSQCLRAYIQRSRYQLRSLEWSLIVFVGENGDDQNIPKVNELIHWNSIFRQVIVMSRSPAFN